MQTTQWLLYTGILCLLAGLASADTIVVKDDGTGDYRWIQDAIDAASSYDTIMVYDGYYPEDITLKSYLTILGESRENTWLRGTGTGHVVYANGVVNTRIEGMAIYNSADSSAGVYIYGGNVTVNNCWITQNGDGIYYASGASGVISNNLINNNSVAGGTLDYALICNGSTPLITNNLIRDNHEVAMYIVWDTSNGAVVTNNTIINHDDYGIWCAYEADPTLKNNLCVNNSVGIRASLDAAPKVSYNNCWNNGTDYSGVTAGAGGLSEDPLFDPATGNAYYYLPESPCIDAGDPDPIYNDIDGTRNDIGFHGGPSGDRSPVFGVLSGFVFTAIGKVPVSELQSSGLIDVDPATASALHIRQYQNAPLGGNPWLFGLFGPEDESVYYYRIMISKWTSSGSIWYWSTPEPLTDNLSKVRYIIQSDGTVRSELYNCGPKTINSIPGMYYRTDSGYWAHPDLKMVWHTGSWADGRYRLTYQAYTSSGNPVTLPGNSQDTIEVIVNNKQPQAEIHWVKDSGGTTIGECGIIDVEDDMDNVQFSVTAYHPDGYLRDYELDAEYGTNKNAGHITDGYYSGSGSFYGISNATINASVHLGTGELDPWHTCAYQFELDVWSRTTDGFNYVRRKIFHDNYYMNLQCAWCGGADINRDGNVNLLDVNRIAQHWLETGGSADCD